MNNRLLKHLFFIICLFCSITASAKDYVSTTTYDFKSDGIYYYIISKKERMVAVGYDSHIVDGCYTGDVVIPQTVKYKKKTYTVTAIGKNTFEVCSRLTSVTLPSTIRMIDEAAFKNCKSLENLVIPNSVYYIEPSAFGECTGLKSVSLPSSLTSATETTFNGCMGLKEIYNHCENPNTIKADNFPDVDALTCILYVPKGTKEAYKASDEWKKFLYIKEF